jgi:hypothetical protein
VLLVLLGGGDGSRNQALQNKTSGVVEEMDLIDDHEVDKVHHAVCLSSDHVPLLRRGNQDVGFLNFRLRHLHISCQFSDLDTQVLERFSELIHDFRGQSLERSDVNNLELLLTHVQA